MRLSVLCVLFSREVYIRSRYERRELIYLISDSEVVFARALFARSGNYHAERERAARTGRSLVAYVCVCVLRY